MRLRAYVGLAALGGAVAFAGYGAIGSLQTDVTEADDVAVEAPVATAKQDRIVPAPAADAAVVDVALLSPRPLGVLSDPAVRAMAAAVGEPADKPELTGSVQAFASAPEPKKPLVVPRFEKDGTLTIEQLTRIKENLNLTPEQERYWAPVEAELRAIVRQLAAEKTSGKKPKVKLSADAAQRLYWAAGPLIMSLRDDQKQQARRLARAMGLEEVASLI